MAPRKKPDPATSANHGAADLQRALRRLIGKHALVPNDSIPDFVKCGESETAPVPKLHIDHQPGQLSESVMREGFYDRGNDAGDAWLLHELLANQLLFCASDKCWYTWRGDFWEKDECEIAKSFVAVQLAEQYKAFAASLAGDPDAAKAIVKHAKDLGGDAKAIRVLSMGRARFGITAAQWDTKPNLLTVNNGVIDLTTGRLGRGRPDQYLRKAAPTDWRGINAPAKRWEQCLREVFKDQLDLIPFFQRLLGYGITGYVSDAKLAIFVGPNGRNGKDTLLKAIGHALGDGLAGPAANAVLMSGFGKTGGGPQTELCALQGMRIAWCSETAEGERLNTAQVKHITGGGRISTNEKYGKQFTFAPTHLPILMTNFKPHAPAEDMALWRRILVIQFNQTFVDAPVGDEQKCDLKLDEALKAEASGILAWLVRGALAWQENGLDVPQSVIEATRKYREEEDTFGHWAEDRCTGAATPNTAIDGTELYSDYVNWSKANGHPKPMASDPFYRRMDSRFQRAKRSAKARIRYQGVVLVR